VILSGVPLPQEVGTSAGVIWGINMKKGKRKRDM
jgi:hypothetical protein